MCDSESKGQPPHEMLTDLRVLINNADQLPGIVNACGPAASASGLAHKLAEELDLLESTVDKILLALLRARQFQKSQKLESAQAIERLGRIIASYDPTIWEQHRIWRVGIGFEF